MSLRDRLTAFAAALGVLLLVSSFASAQPFDRRQNTPGEFDFYVLALSWSPTYCEASSERRGGRELRRPDPQCAGRPYAFVVHGLWPQYERGFPEYCQVPAPRLNRNTVSAMLDLMPSPRLVFHEWDRHGVCSGMSAAGYFETVRKARAVVKIPAEFIDIASTLTTTPAQIEDAFVKANPGLTPAGIAVGCDRRRLREVRICLSREFQFRDCAEVDRRACRQAEVSLPPLRGGGGGVAEPAAASDPAPPAERQPSGPAAPSEDETEDEVR